MRVGTGTRMQRSAGGGHVTQVKKVDARLVRDRMTESRLLGMQPSTVASIISLLGAAAANHFHHRNTAVGAAGLGAGLFLGTITAKNEGILGKGKA